MAYKGNRGFDPTVRLKSLIFGFWICVCVVSSFRIAYAYNLPDTGQTKCYDITREIPCPAQGEPFYGQDAQVSGIPAYLSVQW